MSFDDIENIFNENCFLEEQTELLESNNSGKIIQRVPINSGGIDSYKILRIDPNQKDPFPYFKSGAPYHLKRIVDYILLVWYNNKIYTILIELKTGSGTAIQQLDNSKLFWQYVINVANSKGVSTSNMDMIIKVKLYHSQKENTKLKKPEYNMETECIIYPWTNLRLRQIILMMQENNN